MLVYRTTGTKSTAYHRDDECVRVTSHRRARFKMSKAGQHQYGRFVSVEKAEASGRTACRYCLGVSSA